ncbi:ABC transporter ATP-binding protein [Mesorhizobium sp. B283B1A]|uniref:ABC transporter ATP-binding protein n=1 Tax=Mesorhizobium opportunistum TaxID=593909 RepID=A0ABV1YK91_9HYPH|nr:MULTISPECIES: ABC transporter ATP-binding protein [Mesorhizobium]ESY70426.1 amino acid ABC transporter substrate-binding protein [Mesorhizobium sp. LNHC232B00]ESY81607.1 amino acid ABC transporter substrate-binding protein [Mesorhizobium sp. LNHC221B00]MCA0047284.1 ABC transporter ATP-binding protein [Mesorhizobium sp. B283B1A]TIN91816.1 MAG: ABC transporter ATP-binding protein [Mesorhizobium sp.]TJU94695.1 MAG: ABC transporter ATP-binding protein [Mesorhizobium sp.]
MSFLELRDLHKHYGPVAALAGVDLSIASGSRTAIVGPSGCGKTTLLRLIAGFEAPDQGRIVLDGEVLANGGVAVPAHRRGIGVVAQDGALFPHLTISDNIGFGMSRSEDRRAERIVELAYIVGLDKAILKRRPHELSGGQQQRVALARAMAMKPRLMLLDEPFSALDTGLRASMRKAVAELLEAAGITTILVTHDQAEALSFAAQVAVMRDGKFSQVGTPRELYLRPKDRMIAEFLGDAIILPARISGGFASSPLGRIAVDSPDSRDVARIMLRPEQIALKRTSREGMSGTPDMLFGEVTESEFAGSTCTIAVRLLNNFDPPDAAAIGNTPLILRKSGMDAPAVGEIVRLTVSGKAHVFA